MKKRIEPMETIKERWEKMANDIVFENPADRINAMLMFYHGNACMLNFVHTVARVGDAEYGKAQMNKLSEEVREFNAWLDEQRADQEKKH